MYSEIAGHALGHAKHKSVHAPSRVRRMEITKMQDGKYLVHHPEHGTDHPVENTDALHDHIEQHMGEPNPGEEAAEGEV